MRHNDVEHNGGEMSKKPIACLSIALVALMAGCKKDDEMKAVVKDIDAFTTELVRKVESSQASAAGLDEAQKFLDSKKPEIKAKLDSIKNVRGFQVSEETMKTVTESLTKNATAVASLQLKYISQSVKDPAIKAKLEKIVNDYRALITG